MNTRYIERHRAGRKPVDDVWEQFANVLIKALGDHDVDDKWEDIYCEQRTRDFDAKFLDSLIYNVPPAQVSGLFGAETNNMGGKSVSLDDICAISPEKNTPVLVLGYIGTGKSTFLKHHFKYKLPKRKGSNIQSVFVNFLRIPSDGEAFKQWTYNEIAFQLGENLNLGHPPSGTPTIPHSDEYALRKRLYSRSDLELLFSIEVAQIKEVFAPDRQDSEVRALCEQKVRELNSDSTAAVTQLVQRLVWLAKKKGHILWLILDNLDHHFLTLNANTFLICNEIAKTLGVNVIMALRLVTWNKTVSHGALLTARARHLYLSLPDINAVVGKRIKLLLADSTLLNKRLLWTGNTCLVSNLLDDIQKVMELITSQGLLNSFLLPLCNFSVRNLLDLLSRCFQSYYFFHDPFNNERYLPNELSIMKRLIYATTLGNNEYFDPQDTFSRISNVFDNERANDLGNTLLRMRTYQMLKQFGMTTTCELLVNEIRKLFPYSSEAIFQCLCSLNEHELITLRRKSGDDFHEHRVIGKQDFLLEMIDSVAVEVSLTSAGVVHFGELYLRLEYIEIMKHSTHVPRALSEQLSGIENERSFSARKHGTLAFIKHLVAEEEAEFRERCKNRELFQAYHLNFTKDLLRNVESQLTDLEKQYKNRAFLIQDTE